MTHPARPARHAAADGRGIDPDAPITTTHERRITAPLDVVWRLQADFAAWPHWQSAVLTARRLDEGALVSIPEVHPGDQVFCSCSLL